MNPDQELEEEIQSIFKENNGNYGYRRVDLALRNKNKVVNHKKLQHIMKKLGLKANKFIRKSCHYSSYKGNLGTTAKNLINRHFRTNICFQKLTTDITEFKCLDGMKLYLSPIMDMLNGEILAYGISQHPTLDLAIKPLKQALQITKHANYRTTIHSD